MRPFVPPASDDPLAGAAEGLNEVKPQALQSLASKGPPYFKGKIIRGTSYDLSHLNPFAFQVVNGARSFTVEVIFSCHCFTEDLKAHHTPDLHYKHGEERRAFCVERHALSQSLPSLIQTIGNQSVYWNKNGNFFFWRDHQLSESAVPYLVFFNAAKARKKGVDVLINIDSAHLKPNMAQFASPVKFTTLVEARATGRKLSPGPASQIKRK